jgi:hypothetical protein
MGRSGGWALCFVLAGTPFALACGGAGRQVGYRAEYDEFTRSSSEIVEFNLWSESPFAVPGGPGYLLRVGRADSAVLSFTIDHDGSWRYLTCHRVDILADGEPVQLAPSSHDGRPRAGGVVESISTEMPIASVVQLAGAQRIRVRICNDEFHPDDAFPGWASQMLARPSSRGATTP